MKKEEEKRHWQRRRNPLIAMAESDCYVRPTHRRPSWWTSFSSFSMGPLISSSSFFEADGEGAGSRTVRPLIRSPFSLFFPPCVPWDLLLKVLHKEKKKKKKKKNRRRSFVCVWWWYWSPSIVFVARRKRKKRKKRNTPLRPPFVRSFDCLLASSNSTRAKATLPPLHHHHRRSCH